MASVHLAYRYCLAFKKGVQPVHVKDAAWTPSEKEALGWDSNDRCDNQSDQRFLLYSKWVELFLLIHFVALRQGDLDAVYALAGGNLEKLNLRARSAGIVLKVYLCKGCRGSFNYGALHRNELFFAQVDLVADNLILSSTCREEL